MSKKFWMLKDPLDPLFMWAPHTPLLPVIDVHRGPLAWLMARHRHGTTSSRPRSLIYVGPTYSSTFIYRCPPWPAGLTHGPTRARHCVQQARACTARGTRPCLGRHPGPWHGMGTTCCMKAAWWRPSGGLLTPFRPADLAR